MLQPMYFHGIKLMNLGPDFLMVGRMSSWGHRKLSQRKDIDICQSYSSLLTNPKPEPPFLRGKIKYPMMPWFDGLYQPFMVTRDGLWHCFEHIFFGHPIFDPRRPFLAHMPSCSFIGSGTWRSAEIKRCDWDAGVLYSQTFASHLPRLRSSK